MLKLNMLFFVMDFLTVLVYPFVFIYKKLYPISKHKEDISLRINGLPILLPLHPRNVDEHRR